MFLKENIYNTNTIQVNLTVVLLFYVSEKYTFIPKQVHMQSTSRHSANRGNLSRLQIFKKSFGECVVCRIVNRAGLFRLHHLIVSSSSAVV